MKPQNPTPTLPPPSVAGRPADIFIINPPDKTPPPKKSIAVIVFITLVAICLFVAAILFILVGSASSAANDYRQLEAGELKKIDGALKDLEPSAVINQRSLDESSAKIIKAQKTQPKLRNIVLIGNWSDRYVQTQKLEKAVQHHSAAVVTYSGQLKQLLLFDSSVQAVFNQEPALSGVLNPSDSLSIRSVGGSYENFAKQIEKISSPPQIKDLKNNLVKLYKDKAAAYASWAVGLEQNNVAAATASQQVIEASSAQAAVLTDDQNYVEAFRPSYQALTAKQTTLVRQLES